jgi:hypothetical protein
MTRRAGNLLPGLLVSLLGIAVGISYLIRGFDGGGGTRDITLGAVCLVLGAGALTLVILGRRRRNRSNE